MKGESSDAVKDLHLCCCRAKSRLGNSMLWPRLRAGDGNNVGRICSWAEAFDGGHFVCKLCDKYGQSNVHCSEKIEQGLSSG